MSTALPRFVFSDDYTRASVTEQELARFERRHGIRFPQSLRTDLLRQNGGELSPCLFRCHGNIWCVGGFTGLVMAQRRTSRLYPASDYGDHVASFVRLPKGSDPAKVFIFDYNSLYENYFALDFSRSRNSPSVWRLTHNDRATRLGNTWDDFLSTSYTGEKEPTVEFPGDWSDFALLVDEQFSAPADGKKSLVSYRSQLGIKGDLVQVRFENVWPDGQVSRYEYCFDRKRVILSECSMAQDSQLRAIRLTLRVSKRTNQKESQYENGVWLNSEGCDEQDLFLRSSAEAFEALRTVVGAVYRIGKAHRSGDHRL